MVNKMLSLLLDDVSTAMLVAVLKSMYVDVENTYRVDNVYNLCADLVTKQSNIRGREVTIKRVDYIVSNAVIDRRI